MNIDLDSQLLATRPRVERILAAMGAAPLKAVGAALRGQSLVAMGQIREDLLPLNRPAVDQVAAALSKGEQVTVHSSLAPECATALLARAGLQDATLVAGAAPKGQPLAALPRRSGFTPRALAKALRPHQWVKNVLLFVPVLAAHQYDLATLSLVLWGIAAFSAAASSIYLVNDLLDIDADRQHATKCRRPFAAGTLSVGAGLLAFVALVGFSLIVGAMLSPAFLGVIILYILLSVGYSFKLKRMRWIDIATLAALYTIRVVAGAAAADINVSVYLLVFIYPVFIALGAVKRMTELALAKTDDRLPGRG